MSTILGKLSPEEFLSRYWQKQPLLIRAAIPLYQSPIDPDDLAGLAGMEDVESRVILECDGAKPWQLQHGPFSDDFWTTLPETHWTLLVQECNKYVPELARLMDEFTFVPNWRVDDVMVSFAPNQGSVGPHVDQYDVFLLQALGQRRWQINPRLNSLSPYRKDTDLRILEDFTAEQEWVLNPGDMLYLPPNVAHFGVALEDCMTFSLGFRAPNFRDLLNGYAESCYETVEDAFQIPRYCDPDLALQTHCGEIAQDSLTKIAEIINTHLANKQNLAHWFGRYVTQGTAQANDDIAIPSPAFSTVALLEKIKTGYELVRSEYVKTAFIRHDKVVAWYIAGDEYCFSHSQLPAIAALCDYRRVDTHLLMPYLQDSTFLDLLVSLVNKGYFYFNDIHT